MTEASGDFNPFGDFENYFENWWLKNDENRENYKLPLSEKEKEGIKYDYDSSITFFENISDPEPFEIFRAISTRDIESGKKTINRLKHGKYPKGYDGLGISWTWDKRFASSYYAWREHLIKEQAKFELIYEGLAERDDVDWKTTVYFSLQPVWEDEKELRMKPNADIFIKRVCLVDADKVSSGKEASEIVCEEINDTFSV